MTSWEDIKSYINRYGFLGWVAFSLIVAYLLQILLFLFLSGEQFMLLSHRFMLPPGSGLAWRQPWCFLTYFLIHSPNDILTFIFNILIIMSFAQLIGVVLSTERVKKLMILAVPTVSILTWIIATLLPNSSFIGSVSAPMMVLIFAAVTLMPEYEVRIWGIFPLKLLWIGIIVLLVNVINLKTGYVGAVANLVGSGLGWGYIFIMKKGTDITEIVWDWFENIKDKFSKKSDDMRDKTPFIKVQYKANPNEKASKRVTQDDIDRILDKISEKGYAALTQEEREMLKNASGKPKSDT
jgi:hypothetical protein